MTHTSLASDWCSSQINMLLWIALPAVIFLALLFRFPYFIQDVQYVLTKLKLRRRVLKYMQNNYTILDRFLERVNTQPHKPLVHFNDETFTYKDADELSNKAARAFLQNGLVKEGDTVALFFRNEPMFLWLWLGLVKIGCSVAFLNYNIRSKSLLHCFNCSRARTLVAGAGKMCIYFFSVRPTGNTHNPVFLFNVKKTKQNKSKSIRCQR